MNRSKAQRRAWWDSLTPEQQQQYIAQRSAGKAARPNDTALEAMARLDLAEERHIFMREVPDEDVAERMRELKGQRA